MLIFRIIKGWYRFLFKPQSEMAKKRLAICKVCDLRQGKFCGVCWCELDAKAELEEEKCPKGKW
jgi:hypothetical protein